MNERHPFTADSFILEKMGLKCKHAVETRGQRMGHEVNWEDRNSNILKRYERKE